MGTVIDKKAAADRIVEDLTTTWTRCADRGGLWDAEARIWLGDVWNLLGPIGQEHKDAEAHWTKIHSRLEDQLAESHRVVGGVYDDLWNDLKRPGRDARLAFLFPEAGSTGATGPEAERPDAMDTLAQALVKFGHPRLAPAKCAAASATVAATSTALRTALAASTAAESRKKQASRMYQALARLAQTQLVALKKALQLKGFRETEIHDVIPDHHKPEGDAPEAETSTTPTPATPSAAPSATETPATAETPSEPELTEA